VPADDQGAWTRALRELWSDASERRRRGEESLTLARALLSEDRYHEELMRIYSDP
jgi:hypothetical protein